MEDMYWIDLAEGRERWRAVVNAVMNLCFAEILASQGLCSLCKYV
jgi:hypothetical protein